MKRNLSRRNFLSLAAAAVSLPRPAPAAQPSSAPYAGKLCFFSKHLPEMDARRLAQNVKRAGFDGVDLTVRKGGHILPEAAARDLPGAVSAIRGEGLEVPMITTGLLSTGDSAARPILSTAGGLGIPFFKPGYYKYDYVDVRKELRKAGDDFRGLVQLARQCGIQAGYHNHAGSLGAAVWDIAEMLRGLDPQWAGYYFDPCHAVAEGGVAGWKIALNLVAGRLKMVALKDFYWEKAAGKGWQRRYCPLGQGMVDWKYFFRALAGTGFQGPMSLHLEYDIRGSTVASREENTLAAAQEDLDLVKMQLRAGKNA